MPNDRQKLKQGALSLAMLIITGCSNIITPANFTSETVKVEGFRLQSVSNGLTVETNSPDTIPSGQVFSIVFNMSTLKDIKVVDLKDNNTKEPLFNIINFNTVVKKSKDGSKVPFTLVIPNINLSKEFNGSFTGNVEVTENGKTRTETFTLNKTIKVSPKITEQPISLPSFYKNLDNLLSGKTEINLDSMTLNGKTVYSKADINTLKNTNENFLFSNLQCADLCKNFYKTVWGLDVSKLNSIAPVVEVIIKDKKGNSVKNYPALKRIEKDSDIKVGYLVIQSNGTHSGIVKSISGKTIEMLEQNYTYDVLNKDKTVTTNYIAVGRKVDFDNNIYKVFSNSY